LLVDYNLIIPVFFLFSKKFKINKNLKVLGRKKDGFSKMRMNCVWRYFDRLNNFIGQYGYYLGKREILNVINDGVNGET